MTQINEDLKLDSYKYYLPDHQIADRPASPRHNSKLMVYNAKNDTVTHSSFLSIADFLPSDSLMVLNQSKVFKARILGHKKSGGVAEIFLLGNSLDSSGLAHCLIKTSSKKKIDDLFLFDHNITCHIKKIYGDGTFKVLFSSSDLSQVIEQIGSVPIPPYIRKGESDQLDTQSYQTVYANREGSVAAPTAGLHFTPDVFKSLESKNIDRAFVTLHVGPGTFATVKELQIKDHRMHKEEFFVDQLNLDKLNSGKKIISVGTTSLRVLESTWENEIFNIKADQKFSTDIFLYPGVKINSISAMVTNFHLPKSSLLMLVSALIGREKVLELYELAKINNYRFYSYGDSMLLLL